MRIYKSDFFAVKIDTQKLSFWKLFIKNKRLQKKKISDCATNTSIPLSSFKGTLM